MNWVPSIDFLISKRRIVIIGIIFDASIILTMTFRQQQQQEHQTTTKTTTKTAAALLKNVLSDDDDDDVDKEFEHDVSKWLRPSKSGGNSKNKKIQLMIKYNM